MNTLTHDLTKQDVRALQHADAICFDHNANDEGQIRAIRRAENSSTGFEETHVIPAFSSRVQNYGPGDGPWRAFTMIGSAQYSDIGKTLIRQLRVGTRFALVWTRGNSSPVTQEAGVVRDELRVQVQTATGRTDTFLIDVFVGRDNSARMVNRA